MNNKNTKEIIAYLSVCFFWGSTYIAIKIGVKDFPPFTFAGIRFFLAGGCIIIYSKIVNGSLSLNIKDTINISIVGLFMLLGGSGLVYFAEQWAHSGVTSLLLATVPFFIAIIEVFILKYKRMDYKGFIGLLLGFSGVAYLTLIDNSLGVIDYRGVFLLLMASLCWSIGSVYSKFIKANMPMITNIGIQMLAGGTGLLLVGLVLGEIPEIHFSKKSILTLLYLIVFGSIIAYSCYIYILDKWPASKVGTYAYVNPIITVSLGVVILDEPFTISILISMVTIILAVFMVQRAKIEDTKIITSKRQISNN